ncbi:hypothetical protein NQ317_000276 [Molorchus minor]|uniref:RING-type domain-containing protein n=1 Tax=Molorchus minor TaxID=1323400 RepID=A0ABQ9JAZ8_9CUCU|nr:hypothetical protein NQ317_000276 [Molorchus minor]
MDKSVIFIENISDVIDLSESSTPDSTSRQGNRAFLQSGMTTRSKKKRASAIPQEIIDLSNESDLANTSFEPAGQKRTSLELCCPICLDNFRRGHIKTTTCGHVFCSQCIETYLKEKHLCPMCRKKLNIKDLVQLHL